MSDSVRGLIQRFPGVRVLVIGDAVLDSYLEGAPGQLCREAPVPALTLLSRRECPGGAANVAMNLRSLGAQVTVLSVIGQDDERRKLKRLLEAHGVDVGSLLDDASRRTCSRNRVFAGAQMIVRFDEGSADAINGACEARLISELPRLFRSADAVVVSDYSCGVMTPRIVAALAGLQAEQRKTLLVDSRNNLAGYRDAGAVVAKPNYEEVAELVGLQSGAEPPRAESLIPLRDQVLAACGTQIVAVTLDVDGALVFEKDCEPYRTYGVVRKNYATGAGDTYLAAFALALAAGGESAVAAELASRAAEVAVSKEGASCCSAHELLAYTSTEGKYLTDLDRLVTLLEMHRRQGRRIVFTNGCFDIIHRGHITYLNRAKSPKDILVVGVNSDSSVRRLKGFTRPINSLEDRVQVLGALSCVDYITSFDADTASDLIRVVRPDVFVKGGDYTKERLPEAPIVEEMGGIVRILPFLDDRSTTRIIERMKSPADSDVELAGATQSASEAHNVT